MTTNPFSCLAAIAESQIGTEEDSAHTNRGAAILKYQQATSLGGQGWPWCAAFVDWCIEQFIAQFPASTSLTDATRPRTASVSDWEDWARSHGCLIFTDPAQAQRGDMVTFTFSHIGIVVANDDGHFETVEGNTNDGGSRDGYGVFHKTNRWQAPALVHRFIRLPG